MNYKELPERLNREIIYESDYVCLYADKVKLPNGYIIEKYHQIHYPHEAFAARVNTESMDFDENEVKRKKWVSREIVLEMLKNNETRDGVSILALLFALEFYK